MQDFRNLEVWRIAHALALAIYKATRTFPREELYGLTSQMRRCCVSIPANISEGCGRQSDAEFKRCLHIAMGSACELEYLLVLTRDLTLIRASISDNLITEATRIKRMLASLIQTLRAHS